MVSGTTRRSSNGRALRSGGVVDDQLVEIKFHGFGRWTGRVMGDLPTRPRLQQELRDLGSTSPQKTIVRISWGEAGGEHERDADCGWILHHDRNVLLSTLTAEFQPGRLTTGFQPDDRPRNSVTLVSGPPPGCRFLAPEIDVGDLEWLSGSHVDEERFEAAFKRLRDPSADDLDDRRLAAGLPRLALPLPLLYLVQLEHPENRYRPRFVSLGAAKIADQQLRCMQGPGKFEILISVLVDLIGIQRRHLTAVIDDGVGWRQVFRVAEALVLLISEHPDDGNPWEWAELIRTDPARSRSLLSCLLLAVGAIFSACHSATEIAALLSGGGLRARATAAGWARLEEFMLLLCEDVVLPDGLEDHVWHNVDIPGVPDAPSLNVEATWRDLLWLKHMRELPTGLRRVREDLGRGAHPRDWVLAESPEDPACSATIELMCAAVFHGQSHPDIGVAEMRALGAYFSERLTDLLRRGDRDPLAFAPEDDPFAMAPSESSEGSDWEADSDPWAAIHGWYGDALPESDGESSPPPKRARLSADAMARREALLDHEIAARALHTPPWTRNLRNRSVAMTKKRD